MNTPTSGQLADTNLNTTASVDSRSAAFVPVKGSEEMTGGGELVIAAYALVWALTFVWIVAMWRKQASLKARVSELELQVNRAMAKASKA